MDCFNETNGTCLVTKNKSTRPRAAAKVTNPPQHGTVCNSSFRENAVIPFYKVVQGKDFIGVIDTHFMEPLDFLFRMGQKFCLHITAKALESDRRKNTFRSTARAKNHVNATPLDAAVNGWNYVSISNKADTSTCCPGFTNNVFVSFTIKNNYCKVGNFSIHRVCYILQVFCNRCIDIDTSFCPGSYTDFLHIHIRSMKQTSLRCNSKNRNSPILALCYKIGSFHWIHGNIHFFSASTYMFTNIKHRCFIDFTFPNDYGAGNRSLGKLLMHAINSSLVSPFLIPNTHEATAPKGSLFCNSYKFHRKLSVHCMPPQ